jgi:hypothetical protein
MMVQAAVYLSESVTGTEGTRKRNCQNVGIGFSDTCHGCTSGCGLFAGDVPEGL